MKTLKIFSLAITFLLTLGSFQAGPATSSRIGHITRAVNSARSPDAPGGGGTGLTVNYVVNIHLDPNATICGIYKVEVVNEMGLPVAPPQDLLMDHTSFFFTEQPNQPEGIRIARMVASPSSTAFLCQDRTYTKPSGMDILFSNGTTYNFDLYPQVNPQSLTP